MFSLHQIFLGIALFTACTQKSEDKSTLLQKAADTFILFDSIIKTIHVFVALCDNKYQGIALIRHRIQRHQHIRLRKISCSAANWNWIVDDDKLMDNLFHLFIFRNQVNHIPILQSPVINISHRKELPSLHRSQKMLQRIFIILYRNAALTSQTPPHAGFYPYN